MRRIVRWAGARVRRAARLPAVAAPAVLLMAVATVPAVGAEAEGIARLPADGQEGFSLTYDLYEAGFRGLRLEFDVALAQDSYRTDVRLRTSGIIGFLFDWHLEARSEGERREGELVPARYRSGNTWRGRERWVSVAWRDGVPVEVVAEPPYSDEDRAKVGRELLPGTMDPMSALTAMILSNGETGGELCPPRTRVYDGRRRYDATLSPLGRKSFARSPFARFEGEAEGCRLTFERIAGFDEGRSDGALVADAWLADVGVARVKVPVRLRIETSWGAGFAHLVRARRGDGRVVFGEPGEE